MTSTEQQYKGGGLLDFFIETKAETKKKTAEKKKKLAKKNGVIKSPVRYKSNLKRALASETELIDSYEKLATVSKDYYEHFSRHMSNLITLDEVNGMSGLQTTFKNIIIKDSFTGFDKIDKTNPLLLKNYLVTDNTIPKQFRKEHLLSQIRYKLNDFALKDTLLITKYDVKLEHNMATVTFYLINGEKQDIIVDVDANFIIDMTKLYDSIREMLKSIKKTMDYQIEIGQLEDDFELEDIDIEVPGVGILDNNDILGRKIKKFQDSIKLNSVMLNNAKPNVPSTKKAPWSPMKLGKLDNVSRNTRPDSKAGDNPAQLFDNKGVDIALDQGFVARPLEKPPVDVEKALLDIVAGKEPAMPVAVEPGKDRDKGKDRERGDKSWKKNSTQEFCEKYNDNATECSANKKCHFNATTKKCVKSIKYVKK